MRFISVYKIYAVYQCLKDQCGLSVFIRSVRFISFYKINAVVYTTALIL